MRKPADALAMALLALVLLGGLVSKGYAAPDALRAWAFAACAMAAGVLLLTPMRRGVPPHAWIVSSFLLIPLVVGGLFAIPLPTGLVTTLMPYWSEWAETRLAVGLDVPSRVPLGLAPSTAWATWNHWMASACIAVACLMLARRDGGRTVLLWAVVAVGLLEGWAGVAISAQGEKRAFGLIFNPNHHAALVLLVLPVAVALLCNRASSQSREAGSDAGRQDVTWFMGGVVAVAALGWLLSLSRGSVAAGMLVFCAWGTWELAVLSAAGVSPTLKRLMPVALAVAGLGGVVLWFAGAPAELIRRLDPGADGFGRLDLWLATLQGFVDNRFMGIGLGGAEFALECNLTEVATRKAPVWAHNDYVQFVAELGVLGLALLGAWVFAAGRALAATPLATGEWWKSRRGMVDRAIIAGCASILIHSIVDFPLRIPLIGFCFIALIAVLLMRLTPRGSATVAQVT